MIFGVDKRNSLPYDRFSKEAKMVGDQDAYLPLAFLALIVLMILVPYLLLSR